MTDEDDKLSQEIWDAYSQIGDDFILTNTEAYSYINYIKVQEGKAVRKAIAFTVQYMENLEK